MAIFSRRSIQRMLNENASFLSFEQIEQHVRRLNRNDLQSIDTQWEVAVLNAFSKLGEVRHEPDEKIAKIDLVFTSCSKPSINLIADIVTVSDEGFEASSPVKAFYAELRLRLAKAGLGGTALDVEIFERPIAKRDYVGHLAIPPRAEFSKQIFTGNFKIFLHEIKRAPKEPRVYRVLTDETNILISYKPGEEFSTHRWPSYKEPRSIHRNPVFNALKLKAKQLKKSNLPGLKGIIVCDGDCGLLGLDHPSYRPSLSLERITEDFLRQNSTIDFVVFLGSESGWLPTWIFKKAKEERFVSIRPFFNEPTDGRFDHIQELLKKLEDCFDRPFNIPAAARMNIRNGAEPKHFRPLDGGFSMGGNKFSMSAATVHALLSGLITFEEFSESIRFLPKNNQMPIKNIFGQKLDRGMRIKAVRIVEDRSDDSSIEFVFDRDPAISDFVNPKSPDPSP